MTLQYKDFSPSAVEHKVFSTEYESFSEVVALANEWIRDSGVTVLNVETVVLQNLQEVKDTSQVINTRRQMGHYLFQVLRIWYNCDKPKTP
jgi:hypothetical protein